MFVSDETFFYDSNVRMFQEWNRQRNVRTMKISGQKIVTPRSHRTRQRIMHSFYEILHHVPAHVWSCNPTSIMVAHMHFSVNTTIDICETHFGAL